MKLTGSYKLGEKVALKGKRLAVPILKKIIVEFRYDMFFNPEKTRCTVLEEFETPEGVFEHVKRNGDLIAQLSLLGGKIEGSVFPMNQDGEAIAEIRNNWDSKFHHHFIGKTL